MKAYLSPAPTAGRPRPGLGTDRVWFDLGPIATRSATRRAVVYNRAAEMHFGIAPSVVAPVGLIGGVLAVAWAVLAYRAQRRFLRRALQAIGVVQSLRAERLQRTTIYFPVIQFTTAGGETVTAESKTSKSGLFVGQKIPMLYDPSDPTNLEINSFWSRWVLVWIAASFAVLLLGSGAAAVVALATSVGR